MSENLKSILLASVEDDARRLLLTLVEAKRADVTEDELAAVLEPLLIEFGELFSDE